MIRAARLAVSRPMYAFQPDTFGQFSDDGRYGGGREVRAVWFRRKNGILVAAMGIYHFSVNWGRTDEQPPADTYEAWVGRHTDNRYGGRHLASWDGQALLCTDPPAVPPEVAAERIALLDAMLKGFPDPPASYDGWWTFERAVSRADELRAQVLAKTKEARSNP